MPSPASGTIYQVQLSNESLIAKLLDSKVNDYVTLGFFEKEEVKGRVTYHTKDYVHVALSKFYVMVDVVTKMAYFIDLCGDANQFSSSGQLIDTWEHNQKSTDHQLVTSLG